MFSFLPSSALGNETLTAIRALCEGHPNQLKWREGRAYLVGEEQSWSPSSEMMEGEESEMGILKLTGILRGSTLSADQLVHIPSWGDFAISQVSFELRVDTVLQLTCLTRSQRLI